MEQVEIPDVGGGPAPSAKVIDLPLCASCAPESRPLRRISKEPPGPARFRQSPSTALGMEKAHAGAGEARFKRGRPAKAEQAHAH